MARKGFFIFVFIMLVASCGVSDTASGEEAGLTIARFVTAEDVVDREPVGAAETFPGSTATVYCFLEAKDIAEDTEVSFTWYYGGEEVALVTLLIKESSRWRTFSSKRIAGRTGQWSVALKDEAGNTLRTVDFTVQ